MMSTPSGLTASVLIWNYGRFLPDAIDSVLAQTGSNVQQEWLAAQGEPVTVER